MPDTHQILAVTFDAGGTLFAPHPSVGHVYAEVAARHGLTCDIEKLNAGFLRGWRERTAFDYSKPAWLSLVQSAFAPHLVSHVLFEQIYHEFNEARHWHVFKDVHPALETLRANGIRMAILSNWDDRLPQLILKLGLGSFFEFVLYSGAIGHHKPSLEIFRSAQSRLGLDPSRILHVGDSIREDGEGARNAGWHSLVIQRDGSSGGLSVVLPGVFGTPHHLSPSCH